jgi:hypothetical protein
MLTDVWNGLGVLAALFAAHPIPFAIGTTIVVTLIYFKWKAISHVTVQTAKGNYQGWVKDGQDRGDFFVMKPKGFLKVAFLTLGLFGSGAVFYALVVLQEPTPTPQDWFVFAAMCAFSAMGFWALWYSFTRFRVYDDHVQLTRLFLRPLHIRFDEVAEVRPISKTIAGGVYVFAEDGTRLRVIPRMTGYRQLLERLAERDLKLRIMLPRMTAIAERQL